MTRQVKKSEQLGYSQLVFISEVIDGEYLDTKVIINDQLLCVIEGNKIAEFAQKLQMLVEKYRI